VRGVIKPALLTYRPLPASSAIRRLSHHGSRHDRLMDEVGMVTSKLSVIGLGLGSTEPAISREERRWRREARSAWLRLAVLLILLANLLAGEPHGNLLVHANVLGAYTLATAAALALALGRRGPAWTGTLFVVIDAALVVALIHEHLFDASGLLEHKLTTPVLAIAFLLLHHVALRLTPRLVVVFAMIVVAGWLSLLVVTAALHGFDHRVEAGPQPQPPYWSEGALVAAFGFATLVAFLLTRDHGLLLRQAIRSEQRRHSLSRFFSPRVVAGLQTGTFSTALERREAAVIFVDLRSFTTFAETATPHDLAELLIEYRQHVTRLVFEWGGTVDKFIGDGVMAVFGHPVPAANDAQQALSCALRLAVVLDGWKRQRQGDGKAALDAGIGLHFGPVVGGIISSGNHDEFTVFGDAVNVAERLERLTKTLGASIVVSAAALNRVPSAEDVAPWLWKHEVELHGRSGLVSVAYLSRNLLQLC
jgi:adenylate cyclase